MEQGRSNAMMTGQDKEVKTKTSHFFPEHGITIEAETLEEAHKELEKITKAKT